MKKAPKWLDVIEYPFEAHYFSVDGHEMHYIDEGKGDILLFVHGTPSWSFDFRHLIKDLRKTFRCIAIDHIGFGLSDKPKNYAYSTVKHSDNLERFIFEKGFTNITLLLHDFGGPIALNIALKYPEKFKKIIALNTWMWSSASEPDFIRLKKILSSPLLPFLYRYFNFSARFILPSSFGKKKLNSEILKQYTAPFSRISEREACIGFAKSLLNDQLWFESLWQKRSVLNTISILFVWGMKDPVLKPKYLDIFVTAFPEANVCKIDNSGHFPQEEDPDLAIAAIRTFLGPINSLNV